MNPIVYITRRATFSAAHRLHSSRLTDVENAQVFGKCNNPAGHGHNYVIEVTLRMPMDPRTGMAMNLVDVKNTIEAQVCAVLDHKHLEHDTPYFKDLPSTAENLSVVCWNLLKAHFPEGSLHEVRVIETENNSAFYRGE